MSSEQITSISTAVTAVANTVLDTFIDLLPLVALIVGVSFAIRYVKQLMNKAGKGK